VDVPMNADILDSLLGHPLGQLVVTVIVAVVTSVVTVRMMTARPALTPPALAPPAPVPSPIEPGEEEALIAAIAAAVYATIGAHRIVYIGPSSPAVGSSWTTEMRTRHHTSHAVTHTRPANE
jgi:hypothetical protein